MKLRSLRVPTSLAVAVVAVPTALALAAASCGGNDPPADASDSCGVYCFRATDAGVPPDGGCPLCADFSSGAAVCPQGCTPLG